MHFRLSDAQRVPCASEVAGYAGGLVLHPSESVLMKKLTINKGPDFTPSQWAAAAMGLLASGGAAHVIELCRNWSVVLIAAGLCVPPAIVGWLNTRKRRSPQFTPPN